MHADATILLSTNGHRTAGNRHMPAVQGARQAEAGVSPLHAPSPHFFLFWAGCEEVEDELLSLDDSDPLSLEELPLLELAFFTLVTAPALAFGFSFSAAAFFSVFVAGVLALSFFR